MENPWIGIGFRITAIEIMPPHLQMLKRGGQVVLICGIDELPDGIVFDEVIVHPDHYEILKARIGTGHDGQDDRGPCIASDIRDR